VAAAPLPAVPCAPGDNFSAQAAIQQSGDTISLEVDVPDHGLHLTADLLDLPADYDLYLADSSGSLMAESVQEGTTPEHVDADLSGGTSYLYIHSDAGRTVDPQDPFLMQVSPS
jgi:hypothetical protein